MTTVADSGSMSTANSSELGAPSRCTRAARITSGAATTTDGHRARYAPSSAAPTRRHDVHQALAAVRRGIGVVVIHAITDSGSAAISSPRSSAGPAAGVQIGEVVIDLDVPAQR